MIKSLGRIVDSGFFFEDKKWINRMNGFRK